MHYTAGHSVQNGYSLWYTSAVHFIMSQENEAQNLGHEQTQST